MPTSSEIAAFLGRPLLGDDAEVKAPADLDDARPGAFVWLRRFDRSWVEQLEAVRPALVICDQPTAAALSIGRIATPTPRLDYIRAVTDVQNRC